MMIKMQECNKLSQDFQRIIFLHCSREVNGVAHMLASFAKQAPTSVWHDAPPDSQALLDDVTIITS
jgi:hypothetical protein